MMNERTMLFTFVFIILNHLVYCEDICNAVNCGSGVCQTTPNPTLPYYCQCSNGSNTILPCPSENPCSHNPCGQGICEVIPNLPYGYLCRCAGDIISLTNCNVTHDVCASNPCVNGVCIEGLTSFICNCLPTWTGRTCNEKIDASCSNSLCGDGKCFQINDPTLPYICLCPNAQFAMTCQSTASVYSPVTARMLTTVPESVDLCNPLNSEACLNGGVCLPTRTGYQCLCRESYTGRFCENQISLCSSNPCQYGGVCYDLQSSYICACPDDTFRSQCLPNSNLLGTTRTILCPCQNGGVCTVIDSQMCVCPEGFTGRFCESVSPVHSCRQTSCVNGGSCYQDVSSSSASCLCKAGYTGRFCEIEYFRCQSNGRFIDQYNCAEGKYFECIHHVPDEASATGILLTRSCPTSLRFNVLVDRCDYAKNVPCS